MLPRTIDNKEVNIIAKPNSHWVIKIKSNQIKKFYLKSVHFITIQHKLSRAFQTDMHNKLHKLNTAQ